MDFSFGDQTITLNAFKAFKHMREEEDCYTIDVIDEMVKTNPPLTQSENFDKAEDIEPILEVHTLEPTFGPTKLEHEPSLPSIQDPP